MKTSNPFKFGSVVDDPYFTDRIEELKTIESLLQSENHLILISPRRYGKTSLITKATKKLKRPVIFLDLQLITDTTDFASQLLKRIYRHYPFERLRQLLKGFRVIPTVSINPLNNEVDISVQPMASSLPLLEDVFNLIDQLGKKEKKPIVILDEFQDIKRIEGDLDRKLRAVIQHHSNVNYAFLGSLESMMKEIFEQKKSAFYHFGQIMPLGKIPADDFTAYLLNGMNGRCSSAEQLTAMILNKTRCHPYYTQHLAFTVWNMCEDAHSPEVTFRKSMESLVQIHDMDYERLWQNQNQTDKKILIALAQQERNILTEVFTRKYGLNATSTVFSSLKRLMKQGYVLKQETHYELDDPFFAEWIQRKREA